MESNYQKKSSFLFVGILLVNTLLKCHAATPDAADFTQGAHAWANNCARCHNLRAPTEFSPDQWQVIMQHMRIQGGLTGKEARNITAFLKTQSSITQASNDNSQQASPQTSETTSGAARSGTPTTISKSGNQGSNKNLSLASSGLSGSTVYHQTCIACHGANGKGAVPGTPDFTSKNGPLGKSDALLLQHIENGYQSPGSSMAMPARGGNPKLSNDDLKNALTYIRQTFGK